MLVPITTPVIGANIEYSKQVEQETHIDGLEMDLG